MPASVLFNAVQYWLALTASGPYSGKRMIYTQFVIRFFLFCALSLPSVPTFACTGHGLPATDQVSASARAHACSCLHDLEINGLAQDSDCCVCGCSCPMLPFDRQPSGSPETPRISDEYAASAELCDGTRAVDFHHDYSDFAAHIPVARTPLFLQNLSIRA